MSHLEIRPAHTRRERMVFIKLPWQFYRDDPCWVPPLIADMKTFINPRKGVFFDHGDVALYVAYRDGKPVGRISAQISRRHDAVYEDNKGFFGFFECENNQETANALFAAAEAYLAAQGRTSIEGPFNFTIYDEIGVLVEGFDSVPYVLNIHNPPYYVNLLQDAGYNKAVDWYAYRITAEDARQNWSARLFRVTDRIIGRRSLHIRTMDPNHFDEEVRRVKQIFDAAWSRNWGHVQPTDREFFRIAEALKQLIIPELSLFAEINGQPVGFALSVYDANPLVQQIDGRLFPFGFLKLLRNIKKADRFRLMLMGVLEQHRNRGYEVVFATQVMRRGLELGFRECEMSNIVEDNEPMLKSMHHLPGQRYKTYRIFSKRLNQTAATPLELARPAAHAAI